MKSSSKEREGLARKSSSNTKYTNIVQRGITILSAGALNADQIEAQKPDETHVVMRSAIRTSCPMLNQTDGTVGLNPSDEAQI